MALSRPASCGGRRALNAFLVRLRRENRNIDLFSKRGELLDRSGSLQVAGDERRRMTLFFEQSRQLGGRSCFARTIQSNNQNSCRLLKIERRRITAKEDRQFIIENFDDLLTGRNAAQYFFTKCFRFDARDKFLRDLKIDIAFHQSEPHLSQRMVDVGLADLPVTAKVLENFLQLVTQLRKHGSITLTSHKAVWRGQAA